MQNAGHCIGIKPEGNMRIDLQQFAEDLNRNRINRRQVLWLLGAGALSGCAASPIGGGSILSA